MVKSTSYSWGEVRKFPHEYTVSFTLKREHKMDDEIGECLKDAVLGILNDEEEVTSFIIEEYDE